MRYALGAVFLLLLSIVSTSRGYSGGAPVEVCEDMTPKHPAPPQEKRFPYSVTANKDEIKLGETVEITIAGKPFKGFLLQVRDGDKAVGSFKIPDDHKYAKAITCFGGKTSAATHKNSAGKKSLTLNWTPPRGGASKTYTVYVTVAEDGSIYWVRKPTVTIKVTKQ